MIVFTMLLMASSTLAASIQEQKVYYDPDDAVQHFEEFVQTYGRQYADEEEKQRRFEIFENALAEINQLNLDNDYAVFGITEFADYSKEEISRLFGVDGQSESVNATVIEDFEPVAAPEAFDWRERNVVSAVKNQERCGSCWAFSAIGSLESQYAIKHGQIIQFSEQQLVDCDTSSKGCQGGWMSYAYEYFMNSGGAMTEQDYPYSGRQGQCAFDASRVQAKVVNLNMIRTTDEEQLKGHLYQDGPIAMAIDASTLHRYRGGVVTSCQGHPRLHAVLLIGYGIDSGTRQPYWLFKNSWSAQWGEQGFFRMGRGRHVCGITRYQMITPVVA